MHKNDRASWKRSLVLVWLGEAFSVLTSSVLQMGLIWHVTLTTGSAGVLSLVSLVGFLPMAVLGVFAGTIVDRSSTKRLMIGADLFIAGVSCTLAFGSAVGGHPVRAVAAMVFVRALGTTLRTPAFNALTPMLARRRCWAVLPASSSSCNPAAISWETPSRRFSTPCSVLPPWSRSTLPAR